MVKYLPCLSSIKKIHSFILCHSVPSLGGKIIPSKLNHCFSVQRGRELVLKQIMINTKHMPSASEVVAEESLIMLSDSSGSCLKSVSKLTSQQKAFAMLLL